jgi:aminoglycoside phosphotransferase (APT) family kinase protein
MKSIVTSFLSRRWRTPERTFRLTLEPIHGGLESTVARARISTRRQGDPIPSRLVVKRLPVGGEREAEVYDLLWRHVHRPPTARIFGRDVVSDRTYLYLEDVRASVAWPWSNTAVASLVCRELARLHEMATLPRGPFDWDYETELAQSAESTLELAITARGHSGERCWSRTGDLRRVVAALPRIRRRLLSQTTTIIHGDVHPGNVMVRQTGGHSEVVLIDWGRARLGCPLEDISSWLHSLGCWEPQARRRHDTLMRAYLEARHQPRAFTREVRTDYWMASAGNGLSGAIRYHLAVLSDPSAADGARHDSRVALMAWQRVVRRAATLLNTNLVRCM